ncbi:MAG: class I SAM-dependent methyltransferase [Gammaproteobacteria bacterium]|nr:class I SAM-dependent methyltransferase [Gammaproteobacteria bacterium]
MDQHRPRKTHASLDTASRLPKARKVERLLSGVCELQGAHVLEIGTGSGVIANHFAQLVGPTGRVQAVDVQDQRTVRRDFDFTTVTGTSLPFADDTFDICISNHVLEHVGDRHAQADHLAEIGRVLKDDGWLYLAVPNRWTLVEPHYKLPLLSWLPSGLRDRYVSLSGRGTHYDCDPPSHRQLEALLRDAAFDPRDVSIEGIKVVADLECCEGWRKWILQHPDGWAPLLSWVLPSYLYLATSSGRPGSMPDVRQGRMQ